MQVKMKTTATIATPAMRDGTDCLRYGWKAWRALRAGDEVGEILMRRERERYLGRFLEAIGR